MIESGNKKEEYREIKKYWIGRLAKCGGHNSYEKTGFYCKKAICFSCITRGNGFHPKEYTHVRFRFGYTQRTMLFELESITIGVGNTNWGAPDNECVFILKLGKCIKKNESSCRMKMKTLSFYVNMVRFLTVHIATMYGSAWMVISMICTKVIRFTLQ